MTKIYITYFYNIRFFKPYQIPVSTAAWDPKWYHNNGNNTEIYLDKNGVMNGFRIEELNPVKCNAANCCPCAEKNYNTCPFLKTYREGLDKVNFNAIMAKLNQIAINCEKYLNLNRSPEIILIVYEKPDNPCSERVPIIEWFAKHGVAVEEWQRPLE